MPFHLTAEQGETLYQVFKTCVTSFSNIDKDFKDDKNFITCVTILSTVDKDFKDDKNFIKRPLADIFSILDRHAPKKYLELITQINKVPKIKNLLDGQATIIHLLAISPSEKFIKRDRLRVWLQGLNNLHAIKDKNNLTPLDYAIAEGEKCAALLKILNAHVKKHTERTFAKHGGTSYKYFQANVLKQAGAESIKVVREKDKLEHKPEKVLFQSYEAWQKKVIDDFNEDEKDFHTKRYWFAKKWNALHVLATVPTNELIKFESLFRNIISKLLKADMSLKDQLDYCKRSPMKVAEKHGTAKEFIDMIDEVVAEIQLATVVVDSSSIVEPARISPT